MSEQTDQTGPGAEQWASFQRIWTDTFNKMLQLGGAFSPDSAPPEFVKQMRSSIFQAMAQSWDEFLRSPQFLDGMKQWMESAIAFRQMTNDVLARAHDTMQTAGRTDMEAVLQAIRHLEQRLCDRIEDIEARLPKGNAKTRTNGARRPAAKAKAGRETSRAAK